MSKRKQALRSLSANECGAVSAQPTEPIRAQFFQFESSMPKIYLLSCTFELSIIFLRFPTNFNIFVIDSAISTLFS